MSHSTVWPEPEMIYIYHDQLALIKNLKTLLEFRSGNINIDGLAIHHLNNLIYTISLDIVT